MFGIENVAMIWFFIGLFLILAELAAPGFIIIFFGIGAWITTIMVLVGLAPTFNIQLLIFLFASVASLLLFRKKGKRIFEGKVSGVLKPGQSVDDVQGSKAVVKQAILPPKTGKVEYHGTLWEAESEVAIQEGAVVEIIERVNLTLRVKPMA
ncbi:NfeD family protein [candidate division KSB1 bacterium]|nr:NfeD family protein [candidate division KSB1 bacterium]